jgi:protein phosphatase 1 regulatory subunit 37
MATSSSCSPSSSAVTIPIPGKSILKRPPPTQTGILSRIKGFLPTQPTAPVSDNAHKPLKRAHFILPHLATIYPISTLHPPSTPSLKDEKRAVEERETERRKRIVRGNSIDPGDTEEWWNLDKVESFYRECCASREEEPDPAVSAAFKVRTTSTWRRSAFPIDILSGRP